MVGFPVGRTIAWGVPETECDNLSPENTMPYWKLFYHVVWATRYREGVIQPAVEPAIHNLLRTKAVGLGGTVFALNGMEDHVHLVVSVPPKLALADFIGKVKGAASARFNKSGLLDRPLYWQEEYGILSFDQKRLPRYIAYVENQKAHHSRAELIPVLERTGESTKKPPPEDEP
jgi:putative transposase